MSCDVLNTVLRVVGPPATTSKVALVLLIACFTYMMWSGARRGGGRLQAGASLTAVILLVFTWVMATYMSQHIEQMSTSEAVEPLTNGGLGMMIAASAMALVVTGGVIGSALKSTVRYEIAAACCGCLALVSSIASMFGAYMMLFLTNHQSLLMVGMTRVWKFGAFAVIVFAVIFVIMAGFTIREYQCGRATREEAAK